MKLVRYKTNEGVRTALVVKEGRKWMHVALIGETHLKKLRLTEQRYMTEMGDATKKQIAQFNRVARNFGASRRLVKA